MSTYLARESAVIEAPAERLYGIIADYHEGHPAILPARYFSDLTVVEGGLGLGTVIPVATTGFPDGSLGHEALATRIRRVLSAGSG